MIHTKKLMLAIALTAGAGLPVSAQTNGSNSPYSRYGFGLLSDRAQGFNKGMSGLSYGMSDGKELNFKNPASYSSIDSLSFLFDVGISLQKANLQQGHNKINANNSSLDYVSMGFRASRNLGISLGMMPFSTIGYNISDTENMDLSTGQIAKTESNVGDGGLHEVYGGIGWRPFDPIAIGMNVGYLWGSMKHTVMASFSDASIASRRRQYEADISTFKINFGAQYTQILDKKNSLTLGLTYDVGHNIGSDGHYYDQKVVSGSISSGDTLTARNAFQLPHTFGAGIVWNHDERLRAGFDYSFQKWSNIKSPSVVTLPDGNQAYQAKRGDYTDMHQFTVGMEYQHNPNGIRWSDFIHYRAGFSFSTPYAKIDGKNGPRSYSASLGVGLPIINRWNNRSLVNISAQYERVEPQFSGMITENYFRISIGLSFNERWFMKWKVE